MKEDTKPVREYSCTDVEDVEARFGAVVTDIEGVAVVEGADPVVVYAYIHALRERLRAFETQEKAWGISERLDGVDHSVHAFIEAVRDSTFVADTDEHMSDEALAQLCAGPVVEDMSNLDLVQVIRFIIHLDNEREDIHIEVTKARNVLTAAGVTDVLKDGCNLAGRALGLAERIEVLVNERNDLALGALDVTGLSKEDIDTARVLREWKETPQPIMPVPKYGVQLVFFDSGTDEDIAEGLVDWQALPAQSSAVELDGRNYFVDTVHQHFKVEDGALVALPEVHVHLTKLGEGKFSVRDQLTATIDSIEREHGFLARLVEDMLVEADVDKSELIEIAQDEAGAHELTARINITKDRALELLSQGILGIDEPGDGSEEVH